jgi:hypothetical protein
MQALPSICGAGISSPKNKPKEPAGNPLLAFPQMQVEIANISRGATHGKVDPTDIQIQIERPDLIAASVAVRQHSELRSCSLTLRRCRLLKCEVRCRATHLRSRRAGNRTRRRIKSESCRKRATAD